VPHVHQPSRHHALPFLLAHLSDPHVGPLPQPRLVDLIGKRLTGYWNWHSKRRLIHNMAVLEAIVSDIRCRCPQHVALGGDLVNIGLGAEFDLASRLLAPLGPAADVSIVPGNHDAYVGESLRLMQARFGGHMRSDQDPDGFPFLRRRGGIALVGVSTAIPTLPFLASGAIGMGQLGSLDRMLAELKQTGEPVVILMHHAPHQGGSRLFRGLRDAASLEAIIARHGAALILHGHNHKRSLAWLDGPDGSKVPAVGVASASAVPGDADHRAAWHLYHIDSGGSRPSIRLEVRGMEATGAPIRILDEVQLT